MKKDLVKQHKNLVRYGEIVLDQEKEDSTGYYRLTRFYHEGFMTDVRMKNGEIISIKTLDFYG